MQSGTASYAALIWLGDRLRLLDQTRLPGEEVYIETRDYREVAAAIKELKVRGAPAIGVAAAYGVALGALEIQTLSPEGFVAGMRPVIDTIGGTRPTARNLFSTLERMEKAIAGLCNVEQMKSALVDEALRIHNEEIESTRRIADFGAGLIKDGWTVLTHCNTGPLATTGYGTALGVIIRAHEQGKKINVFATETRPLLQGARLTVWELGKAGIPVTLITDSMAGYFMKQGHITCVIVGADRIAANGDTANKIGTYTLAVLAHEHGIPFYVAAPSSTIDSNIATGDDIVIEERQPEEVTHIRGVCVAAAGCRVANPAFDVTPRRYITGIVTETGMLEKTKGVKI